MTDTIPTAATEAAETPVSGFLPFGLPEELISQLTQEGLHQPTPIQQMAIPPLMEGRDLIGLAQTGTGKTAAFLLPLLASLPPVRKPKPGRLPKALILSPTRELATQIATNFTKLAGEMNLRQVTLCGGMRYDHQIRHLRKGIDVVIATPGRLEDLMERGEFQPDDVGYFVLDEADHMLDLGFYPAIKRISAALPTNRQTMLFSATMPDEIAELAKTFLSDPEHVTAPQTGLTVDRIKQEVTFLAEAGKRQKLLELLTEENADQALIFVRTKRRADFLADYASKNGVDVDVLHGDLKQAIRLKVLRKFREGKIQAVIATDVAARGIDVSGLSLVVNYDLTDTPEAYVHRVGRTGRAGSSGLALSFCAPDEKRKLADIIAHVGQVMTLFDSEGNIVEEFSASSRGQKSRNRPPAHARKRDGRRRGGADRGSDRHSDRPIRAREPRPAFSRFDPADDGALSRADDSYEGRNDSRQDRQDKQSRRRADTRSGGNRPAGNRPDRNRSAGKPSRWARDRDERADFGDDRRSQRRAKRRDDRAMEPKRTERKARRGSEGRATERWQEDRRPDARRQNDSWQADSRPAARKGRKPDRFADTAPDRHPDRHLERRADRRADKRPDRRFEEQPDRRKDKSAAKRPDKQAFKGTSAFQGGARKSASGEAPSKGKKSAEWQGQSRSEKPRQSKAGQNSNRKPVRARHAQAKNGGNGGFGGLKRRRQS